MIVGDVLGHSRTPLTPVRLPAHATRAGSTAGRADRGLATRFRSKASSEPGCPVTPEANHDLFPQVTGAPAPGLEAGTLRLTAGPGVSGRVRQSASPEVRRGVGLRRTGANRAGSGSTATTTAPQFRLSRPAPWVTRKRIKRGSHFHIQPGYIRLRLAVWPQIGYPVRLRDAPEHPARDAGGCCP